MVHIYFTIYDCEAMTLCSVIQKDLTEIPILWSIENLIPVFCAPLQMPSAPTNRTTIGVLSVYIHVPSPPVRHITLPTDKTKESEEKDYAIHPMPKGNGISG
jgi:hypothetical protein